jgi:predicted  nucleic acid-binding Zn-ribbon protein
VLKAVEQARALQALDSQIDGERERITTIEATLHDRSEYEGARRRHQEAAQALRKVEAEQKDLDLQLGTARTQLSETEGRLYGGRINNPRELRDLESRGADLRRQIGVGEERMLAVMEQLEAATAAATGAEQQLREIVAARRTQEADLLAERKSVSGAVRQHQAERDRIRSETDPATLRLYDRLRSTRGGVAVAEVKQRICQGCRVSLTAALEQRLRQGAVMVTCQSCGRILYINA